MALCYALMSSDFRTVLALSLADSGRKELRSHPPLPPPLPLGRKAGVAGLIFKSVAASSHIFFGPLNAEEFRLGYANANAKSMRYFAISAGSGKERGGVIGSVSKCLIQS